MIFSRKLIASLGNKYGNAFYLLDSKQFEENYTELKKTFSSIYSNVNIAYSYKTNYIPRLCKIVNENDGYAEIVSDMEMELALRCGVETKKIIWNGPIKDKKKIETLLCAGGTVNADSLGEIENIAYLAENNPDYIFNVGIRCNYDVGDGVVSRFGIDVDSEDFIKSIEIVRKTTNMHLINLQCHFAKRNVEYWIARSEGMLRVVDRVAEIIGYVPDRIDLGGGIYGNMQESLKRQFQVPIPSYLEYANIAATKFLERFPNTSPELLIEPGTALVGDCMSFVCRVEHIKKIKNKYFATVLGSQKNINMSGINPPMEVLKMEKNKKMCENFDIVGYTCIENDVLYSGYKGELAIGDYLVFSNCGSYSIVMKPPFILPNFPVLDISGKAVELIKYGETFDDLFHTFVF